tara:strand:- start:567 stop:716 length:150 start_codon:yes stop_codon:yes gene_type:complete
MKILVLLCLIFPVSERPIDVKDCTMWKYGEPETYEWCLEKPTPEIIREL